MFRRRRASSECRAYAFSWDVMTYTSFAAWGLIVASVGSVLTVLAFLLLAPFSGPAMGSLQGAAPQVISMTLIAGLSGMSVAAYCSVALSYLDWRQPQ